MEDSRFQYFAFLSHTLVHGCELRPSLVDLVDVVSIPSKNVQKAKAV